MKTILVDDELLSMDFFVLECQSIGDIEIVGRFSNPLDSLRYAQENPVDLAVLDIEMPEMNGIELGRKLKGIHPAIILIYITAYDQYASEAYNLRVPVFLEKPYNRDDVIFAIETAKLLSRRSRKAVFIRTFGNFDVFINDKLLHFSNSRAKELLALLVDRQGSSVSTGQAIACLWEDAPCDFRYQNRFRRVLKDLRDTLGYSGIGHILISNPNSRAVDPTAFDCDYYWYLQGNAEAVSMFRGEYMSQYSWAESTLASLVAE